MLSDLKSMFEKYRTALAPDSLVQAIPRHILQNLMQSFYFGNRAGTVLIYDEGIDSAGELILKRLDPVDPDPQSDSPESIERFQNFNPFCAKLREHPSHNAMCEACDLHYSKMEFAGTKKDRRYECHMGLIDMTIPIKISGRVRGVLYAGQKIIKDDVPMQQRISENIRKKAEDISGDLSIALVKSAQSAAKVELFEKSFVKFADTFQTTVDALVNLSRGEAERGALLDINEELKRSLANDVTAWTQSAASLFQQLEIFLDNSPLWLLQRRGSRYRAVIGSPLGMNGSEANIPVATLITASVQELVLANTGSVVHQQLEEKLRFKSQTFTLIRVDTPIGGGDVKSIILVVGAAVPEYLGVFMVGCAGAMAYPAGVAELFRRLDKQRSDFARTA